MLSAGCWVNDMDLHSIELFSGVGMLGEGLRAGFGHLGIQTRTLVHVEREAYAAAVLAARMEEGSLDEAPVWSDVCTFDALAWRGLVDCIVAGFPCQDLSVAGRRAGLDGKRSGLFFEVVRIARDSGAWLMVLENVAGIATATATVVDAEEGELEERAAARVLGELADLGWDAEWITLSASDVGASHGRSRWFCLAWRVADAGGDGGDGPYREGWSGRGIRAAGDEVEHAGSRGRSRGEFGLGRSCGAPRSRRGEQADDATRPGASLEQPSRFGRQERRPESAGQQGRLDAAVDGGAVADAGRGNVCGLEPQHVSGRGSQARDHACSGIVAYPSSPRLPQPQQPNAGTARGGHEGRAVEQLRGAPLFAPGPSDARWAGIIAEYPWLAPALSIEEEHDAKAAYAKAQSVLRGEPDGVEAGLDFDHRQPRLKCIGNGVVALQAAAALVVLARRAGIFEAAETLRDAA